MEKDFERNAEFHEALIRPVAMKHFGEYPRAIERISIGICNEVYNVQLSDKEIIARLSSRDYFLKGSHNHIPLLKDKGIIVPEILAEDYSKKDMPYAYQFLSKLPGKDIGLIIDSLSDEQLTTIAKEISLIFDKVKTIPASDKFGLVYGDHEEFSDTWTERMKIWIDESISQGTKTGIMNERFESILSRLYNDYKDYFDHVLPITYLGDVSSKNVMVDNGEFTGVVDLDGLTQGDPLEAIGRIKASWPGTHYGEVYTSAIMAEQHLNGLERKMVLVYALLNRISWACENGIQFNKNTSSIVDHDRAEKDKMAIDTLINEYEQMQQ